MASSTATSGPGTDARNRLKSRLDFEQTQAASLSPDDPEESQGIALRCALDRLRGMSAKTDVLYGAWRQSAEEVTALRQQLAAISEQAIVATSRLDALVNSRGFRLFRRLWRLRRFLPLSPRRKPATILSPSSGDSATSVGNSTSVASAVDSAATEPAAQMPSAPPDNRPPELIFSPLSWKVQESSAPDFINLIILSANHRAGSTLLQRICNARKGTLIWGEHGGLLNHFASIYLAAAYFSVAGGDEHKKYFGGGENPNVWIANMCPTVTYAQQAVVDSARAFLRTFYGQYREHHDILGFKEVAYGRPELELLRQCYPKAQILLLVRNPMNTWRSTPRSWYPTLDEWMAKWNASTSCFQEFAKCDANSHLIRYEDIVKKEPGAMAILAEAAKVHDEEISLVLGRKLGSHNAGISAAERELIADRCRESMQMLGYSA